ncbi:SurA N-terminal domain-containing protein [Bacillus suaedaesalsae]|uniref:peptidylprolyl isomerase n=1 Tax=Bacillus suaedaesalsae TaxID=2810349 RepID=A0ABS2DG59_9BACI|nr:SurA N-terminal domain-containing protein [Bacillus suaedaesalsae]MBM6616528.1 SurA N-terminal domain-containing protein [Bacillus suaedaesalsae]
MKKNFFAAVAVATSIMLLGACNSDKEEKAKDGDKKEAVASVNGVDIPRSEYDILLEETKAMYAMQGMTEENMDEATKKQMETQVIDQLINTELLFQQAKEDKITISKEDIDKRLEEMKANFDDEKKFKDALEENKLTEESLKERIEKDLLITQYLDKNIGEVNVTDAEIQASYEKYKESMKNSDQEAPALEDVKEQLKQQTIAEKEQNKVVLILQGLRGESEIKTF